MVSIKLLWGIDYFLFNAPLKSMRKFRVKSRSQNNIYYEVEISDNGGINCNCPSGSRNKACNHIELVIKFVNRKPVNAIEYDRLKEIK